MEKSIQKTSDTIYGIRGKNPWKNPWTNPWKNPWNPSIRHPLNPRFLTVFHPPFLLKSPPPAAPLSPLPAAFAGGSWGKKNLAMEFYGHRNRWFTELKHGGSFQFAMYTFNRGYMTVDHPENHGKHVSTVLYQPKNVDMIRKKYVLVDLLHLGFAYNKKIQM